MTSFGPVQFSSVGAVSRVFFHCFILTSTKSPSCALGRMEDTTKSKQFNSIPQLQTETHIPTFRPTLFVQQQNLFA